MGYLKLHECLMYFALTTRRYEQTISQSWDSLVEVQCYLPPLEAGWHNMSIHVAHFTKSVIQSPSEGNVRDMHTQPLRGPTEGLGSAMWNGAVGRRAWYHPERTLVSVVGDTVHTMLVVPQMQSMSTQISGVLGRHELVIRGSGFAPSNGTCAKNTVMLSGVPCAVTSCTPSEIKCSIGPMSADSHISTAPFPSTFGLHRRTCVTP